MNKRFFVSMVAVAALAFFAVSANAQEKKTEVGKAIQKTGKAIDKGATVVGNKTAEVAVKGASKVADQTYKGKIAPDGSSVYIDGENKKYYINKKGAKIFLKASQIRNKVN